MTSKKVFLSFVAFAALSASAPSLGMNLWDTIKGELVGRQIFTAVVERDSEKVESLVKKWKINCGKCIPLWFKILSAEMEPLYNTCEASSEERTFGDFDSAYKIIDCLLKKGVKDLINHPIIKTNFYSECYTPFTLACKGGSLKIVKLFVENGADINKIYSCEAIINKKYSRKAILNEIYSLEEDGSSYFETVWSDTPIFSACHPKVHHEIVKFLLGRGADGAGAIPRLQGENPTGGGAALALKYLTVAKAYDQSPNEEKMQFIERYKEDADVYSLLVMRSIFRNYKSNSGETIPYLAWCKNNLEIVKLLLKNGEKESINKADINGLTLLNLACLGDNLEVVKLLLENGAEKSIDLADNNGWKPLDWACYNDNIEIAEVLLKNGAKRSINIANNAGETPLFWARKKNNQEMIKLLLENGAKEYIGKDSEVSIFRAIEAGNLDEANKLAKIQDVNKIINNFGQTPIYLACIKNNLGMVKLLLENGAKESVNDFHAGNGETPLYWACKFSDLKMVKLLLENGAGKSANLVEFEDGRTPLWWACFHKNVEIANLLLPHCSKDIINKKDKIGAGFTPLFWAKLDDNLPFIKLLVENGAEDV